MGLYLREVDSERLATVDGLVHNLEGLSEFGGTLPAADVEHLSGHRPDFEAEDHGYSGFRMRTNAGNLGVPLFVSSWYLNEMVQPMGGGLARSASEKPVPTLKFFPLGRTQWRAPIEPV